MPKARSLRLLSWALAFLAVLFMTLELEGYRLPAPCETGNAIALIEGDPDEPASLPVSPLPNEKPVAKPKPVYPATPDEVTRSHDLEVEQPPPRPQ